MALWGVWDFTGASQAGSCVCACVCVGSWVALGGCLWVGGVSGSGSGCLAVWWGLVGSGGGGSGGLVWVDSGRV